ncbi:PREDICTED: uncharacterized protein LOC101381712 [Odobenus rosmarus divergens]|uniref:Uncharacterized protein LOC101381712 n=1 Tax=Odobenus rosmarus divergens TaxID=9708 RepID=A0A9B0H807_ODORO
MAALELSGGGPNRSSPNNTWGQRLPFRTEEGLLRLPEMENLCQDGGREAGLASPSFTKMAASSFRHALPPILFKMSEQRRPLLASERCLRSEWLRPSARAGTRRSCGSLRPRHELAAPPSAAAAASQTRGKGWGTVGARGRVGSALQLLSRWESAAAAADWAAQTLRRWETCRHATPLGPRVRKRRPPLLPSPPYASPEGVSGGPAPRAADTLRHRFRATLVARAKYPASSGVGRESRSWAGAGRRQREGKLEKLGFPPKPAPERPGQFSPPLLLAGGWGGEGGLGEVLRARGAAAGRYVPGHAGGRGRVGAVGAPVAGPRRAWGRGLQPPLQLPSVANRLHRSPPPRGPSGGERPGVEWERVCVRVCARRGAASARPPIGPARSPRSGGPFLESVTGAPVTARPSGTDSSGWKETPHPELPKRRGAGTEDARLRAPARWDRRGAGGWLVSREMGDFLK